MNINEYQNQAMSTLNPVLDKKDVLINGVMGLCGESGEAIDIVKKRLAKELGDVGTCRRQCPGILAETAAAIGYDLEDILRMNLEKLQKRYPKGFTVEDSIHRQE